MYCQAICISNHFIEFVDFDTNGTSPHHTFVVIVLSDASFHLPPAAPVLIPLAIVPIKQSMKQSAEDALVTYSSPRMILHRYSRNMALMSLSVAVLSWAHYETRKTKRLIPLPLPTLLSLDNSDQKKKIVLPPFLPERVPPPNPLLEELKKDNVNDNQDEGTKENNQHSKKLKIWSKTKENNHEEEEEKEDMEALEGLPRVKQQLKEIYGSASKKISETQLPTTFGSTMNQWKLVRMERKRTIEETRRNAILQQLVELESLKRKLRSNGSSNQNHFHFGSKQQHQRNSLSLSSASSSSSFPLGYALVTGASRGLGRALAVELARWEIPLILVARDKQKLVELADDIETCYGVPCCVITTDLSKPGSADQLFDTTQQAGLHVDILVNNAGICTYNDVVDSSDSDVDRVLQLNAVSVAKLGYLYGKQMKLRRRGRILFVSSIVGAMPAGPGVATYAATKAFEKSLALSMGKELEPYGVGVTCLIPGAIKGTDFVSQSSAGMNNVQDNAICWKIPFYPKTAPEVANKGIRAMLSGDAEVVNGWQNRFLLRIMTPLLPQRLTLMIVETSFKPLQLPSISGLWKSNNSGTFNTQDGFNESDTNHIEPKGFLSNENQQYIYKLPPRILELREKDDNGKENADDSIDNEKEVQEESVSSREEETKSDNEVPTSSTAETLEKNNEGLPDKGSIERSLSDYQLRNKD